VIFGVGKNYRKSFTDKEVRNSNKPTFDIFGLVSHAFFTEKGAIFTIAERMVSG
jgi:hypothetical protein